MGKFEKSAYRVYEVIRDRCHGGRIVIISDLELRQQCGGSKASMKAWIKYLKENKLIFTKTKTCKVDGGGWVNRRYVSTLEGIVL